MTSIPSSKTPEPTDLGELIRVARLRSGLSQAELASKIGVSQAAVGQWERGITGPRSRHINAASELLGLDPATLHQAAASTITSELGKRIRAARLDAGVSRSALALAVGVSVAAIGHWESGINEPRGQHLQALCDALGIEPVDRLDIAAMPSAPRPAPSPAVLHELLLAELIVITLSSILTDDQRAQAAALLAGAGVAGSTPTRNAERRAAITAAGAA